MDENIKEKNLNDIVNKVWNASCDVLRIDGAAFDIEIEFVEKDDISELNKEHRGKDGVTDVLSFPMLDIIAGDVPNADDFAVYKNPDTGRVSLGSIVICREVASDQAAELGHSMEREIAFLTVHGILHLMGYDHEDETGEAAMIAKQTEILNKAGILR